MEQILFYKQVLEEKGYVIINAVYSIEEIDQMIISIENTERNKDTFRQSTDLFAIRQVLKEIPSLYNIVFTPNLRKVISNLFGKNYFSVKSIYFDKPETSNWYVAYHQDLTISVDKKLDIPGFTSWTAKQRQFAVQPPLPVLENIFTVRIHLDQTNENNGALKVIEKSHLKNIYRPETIDWQIEKEYTCDVESGGIMIMKPLLLHSSGRTTNNRKRRVIHIEFADLELPDGLQWSERIDLNTA
ncbi:phytanoyl-CoA dioxygenase family protein [Sphingobacterium spiritivorum]|uniref:phytanoyl-CoA dioxygenase family protein n=1 Tax=Sphingobacterium TaxID=28453 RepID=UPI0025F661A4|nr:MULTISPECIES: phytanoyl-CoA dioxygenase family protein [unclassified Sphingobacterium]